MYKVNYELAAQSDKGHDLSSHIEYMQLCTIMYI